MKRVERDHADVVIDGIGWEMETEDECKAMLRFVEKPRAGIEFPNLRKIHSKKGSRHLNYDWPCLRAKRKEERGA